MCIVTFNKLKKLERKYTSCIVDVYKTTLQNMLLDILINAFTCDDEVYNFKSNYYNFLIENKVKFVVFKFQIDCYILQK